jgi:hypothetical protein
MCQAAEFRCSMTAFIAGCRIREVRVARAEPAEAFAVSIALSFCFEMKVLSLILVLLGSRVLAQERLPVLSGWWTASLTSGQIFQIPATHFLGSSCATAVRHYIVIRYCPEIFTLISWCLLGARRRKPACR